MSFAGAKIEPGPAHKQGLVTIKCRIDEDRVSELRDHPYSGYQPYPSVDEGVFDILDGDPCFASKRNTKSNARRMGIGMFPPVMSSLNGQCRNVKNPNDPYELFDDFASKNIFMGFAQTPVKADGSTETAVTMQVAGITTQHSPKHQLALGELVWFRPPTTSEMESYNFRFREGSTPGKKTLIPVPFTSQTFAESIGSAFSRVLKSKELYSMTLNEMSDSDHFSSDVQLVRGLGNTMIAQALVMVERLLEKGVTLDSKEAVLAAAKSLGILSSVDTAVNRDLKKLVLTSMFLNSTDGTVVSEALFGAKKNEVDGTVTVPGVTDLGHTRDTPEGRMLNLQASWTRMTSAMYDHAATINSWVVAKCLQPNVKKGQHQNFTIMAGV